MQKMTEKKILLKKIEDQVHIYYPLIGESKIRNKSVLDIINRFFKGSHSKLALHALGISVNVEDIDELFDVVTKLKQSKK